MTAVAYSPRTIEFFNEGEIVTLTRKFRDVTPDTPCVVTGQRKRVAVAVLGGGTRVSVIPDGLVRRDASWLADRLAR